MHYTLPVQLLLAASCVSASPLDLWDRSDRPGDLNYRPQSGNSGIFKTKPTIDSRPETVTANGDMTSQLELAFKPYLNVIDGCSPVAAVDPEGYTAEGLSSKSTDNKDCFTPKQQSDGQMYARRMDSSLRASFSNLDAIMYSWYFPRSTGGNKKSHKHEWQIAVIWLQVQNKGESLTDYTVAKVSLSTPAGYVATTANLQPDGHQVVQYQNSGLSLQGTRNDGSFYSPVVAWEAFTLKAQQALSDSQVLGGYSAPFSNGPAKSEASRTQFQDHLHAAFEAKSS